MRVARARIPFSANQIFSEFFSKKGPRRRARTPLGRDLRSTDRYRRLSRRFGRRHHAYDDSLFSNAARNPETKRNDFPSDANPVKDKARLMIKMTDDLNAKYLAQITDHRSSDAVTCGTCHRGVSHPEAFIPKPHEHGPPPPAAAPPPSSPPQ